MKPFIVVEPFLKELPEGWAVHRLRRVSDVIEETNSDANAPLLSLTIGGELLPRADDVQPPSAEYLLKYGLVRVGDLVVNPMWLTGGSIGVSAAVGAVSPEYRVYRFGRDIHPRFVHHLVRSDPFMHQYRLLVRAETTFDRRVTKEDFRELPLVLPPLGVQRAIADYLDTDTGRIDALIAKKQRMIELLEERLQVAIDTRFSKGDMPTSRIKYVTRLNPDSLSEKTDPNFAFSYIDIGLAGRGQLVGDPAQVVFGSAPSRARRVVQPGDVLVSTVRTYLRAVWCVPKGSDELVVSTGFAILRPTESIESRFLGWYCRSSKFIEAVVAMSVGVSYPAVNALDLVGLPCPLPSMERQLAIAEELDKTEAVTRNVTDQLARQIDLLRERRRALIAAAVTGELEAPGVAA